MRHLEEKMTPEEELLDYRRSVSDIYSSVRNSQVDIAGTKGRFLRLALLSL